MPDVLKPALLRYQGERVHLGWVNVLSHIRGRTPPLPIRCMHGPQCVNVQKLIANSVLGERYHDVEKASESSS